MRMNFGCGPDIKDGWVNVDIVSSPGIEYWNIVENVVPENWKNKFDYILVNHVFCTLGYEEAALGLSKLRECLIDGGIIEVIDMNPLKAFRSLERGEIEAFVGFDGSIDNRFTRHLIGYGRRSLWTPDSMCEILESVGFTKALEYFVSEYDVRPRESFVVKAVK